MPGNLRIVKQRNLAVEARADADGTIVLNQRLLATIPE